MKTSSLTLMTTAVVLITSVSNGDPLPGQYSDISHNLNTLFYRGNSNTADISGKWYYSMILYSDGSVYNLRNRQSGLSLNNDGAYKQNIWVGTSLQGREGKYVLAGKNLTLTPKGGSPEVFAFVLSDGDKTLTLKKGDGSGWKLERLP